MRLSKPKLTLFLGGCMTIVDRKRPEAESLMEYLDESEFDFYLTGSRFFNTNKIYSDWDFFTKDCEEVRRFLSNHDFYPVVNEYNDKLTTAVYRRPFIDVQLVTDVECKRIAQEILRINPPSENFVSRTQTWNFAFSIAEKAIKMIVEMVSPEV